MIVDDYSRFTWILFLAHKDETFKAFVDFAKLVQNVFGLKSSLSVVIMVVNLITINYKKFAPKMELFIISHVRELHNKMVL